MIYRPSSFTFMPYSLILFSDWEKQRCRRNSDNTARFCRESGEGKRIDRWPGVWCGGVGSGGKARHEGKGRERWQTRERQKSQQHPYQTERTGWHGTSKHRLGPSKQSLCKYTKCLTVVKVTELFIGDLDF